MNFEWRVPICLFAFTSVKRYYCSTAFIYLLVAVRHSIAFYRQQNACSSSASSLIWINSYLVKRAGTDTFWENICVPFSCISTSPCYIFLPPSFIPTWSLGSFHLDSCVPYEKSYLLEDGQAYWIFWLCLHHHFFAGILYHCPSTRHFLERCCH